MKYVAAEFEQYLIIESRSLFLSMRLMRFLSNRVRRSFNVVGATCLPACGAAIMLSVGAFCVSMESALDCSSLCAGTFFALEIFMCK